MLILLLIAGTFVVIGILFLFILRSRSKNYGMLAKERVYQDSSTNPGVTLQSTTLPLVGKPDFLIKDKDSVIPVEVKTGRAPQTPYLNHTMQLMAYCLLVEETYNTRPPGGYIRYPDKEFKVAYTPEAEQSVRTLVQEMLLKKESGEELFCKHVEHNK